MATDDIIETQPVDPDSPDVNEPDTPPSSGDEPQEPPVEPSTPDEPKWLYQTIDNFYDRVRSALGIGSSITDEVIDLFENAPMAEIRMVKRVPNYATLDDMKYMLFETCIVYMTCYILCPMASSRRIIKQKDPSLELQFATSNSNDKPCEHFLALIDDLVNEINGTEAAFFLGFKTTTPSPSEPCACNRWIPKVHGIIIKQETDHRMLTNRDAKDQHPIESISGLEDLTPEEVRQIWDSI